MSLLDPRLHSHASMGRSSDFVQSHTVTKYVTVTPVTAVNFIIHLGCYNFAVVYISSVTSVETSQVSSEDFTFSEPLPTFDP
jgi:hypothetical protein